MGRCMYNMKFTLESWGNPAFPFNGERLGTFKVTGDDWRACMSQAWDIKAKFEEENGIKTTLMHTTHKDR